MQGVGVCRCTGVLLLAFVLSCDERAVDGSIEIGATHRFLLGDDGRFAAPDFDDSSWRTAEMPATWRAHTVSTDILGWHRIRFQHPALASEQKMAVDLGAIAWADEAFLNGVRIGGTGNVDELPRLGLRPRLYDIPPGILRAGSNLLAIRVRGIPLGVNGLLARRILIGPASELHRASGRARAGTAVVDGLLFGFMAFAWLVIAFHSKRGHRGRASLFLLGALSVGLAALWLLSATMRDYQLNPEVGANVVIGLMCLGASLHWGFVASIARGGIPPLIRGLMAAQALVGVTILVWPTAFTVLLPLAELVGIATATLLIWMLVAAIRARTAGTIAITAGLVIGAAGTLSMAVLPNPFFAGHPLLLLAFVAGSGLAVLAVTQHQSELNRRAERATSYSLQAHQRERSRLARDLHDGVGQMLALLKLQMQRMGRKHEGEPIQMHFDESADQVAATIDELRRVARDLRPAPLEERGFGEAVREYAAAIAQRTDLEVEVEGDFLDAVRADLGDELYRVTQECLTNCIKHSGARRVVVELSETDQHHILRVIDDGRGLSDERADGIGLETIRERSEIVGGTCEIGVAPGGGTCVEVAVPRSRLRVTTHPSSRRA